MKKRQKVSILVVGEHHTDPAVPELLLSSVKKINSAGVKQVFCREEDVETLESLLKELEEIVSVFSNFISTHSIKQYLAKIENLRRPFLHDGSQAYYQLRSQLSRELQLDEKQADIEAIHISRLEYYKGFVKLLKFIQEKSMPYFSIDVESQGELITAGDLGNEECIRITNMVMKVRNSLLSLKGEDGVLLSSVGVMHAHRLCANLILNLKDLDLELQVVPIDLYSGYSKYYKDNPMIDIALHNISLENDSPAVLEVYKTLPIKEAYATEDPVTGAFSSPVFDAIVNDAIKFVQDRKLKFTVGNLDEDFVKSIGGEVVDRDRLLIAVESGALLRDARERLGLDRRKLTLEEPKLQKTALSNISGLTLEEEKSNVVLVTFPKSAMAEVSRVVSNWKEVREQYTSK